MGATTVDAEEPEILVLVAPAQLMPGTWLPGGELPHLEPGTRILLDCTGVEEISVPVESIAVAGQQLHRMGVKLALLAGRPLVFGLARQAIQLAGLPEGQAFAAFMEREEALRWLRGEPPGQ